MTKHSSNHDASRREFLKAAGIGGAALVVGVPIAEKLADPLEAQRAPRDRIAGAKRKDAAPKDSFIPSMWLAILASGEVKIWAHRSEMGTGIRTSLPMVVADELEADWKRVSLVQGQGDADFWRSKHRWLALDASVLSSHAGLPVHRPS